jgi:hypothetical protein
MVSMGCTVRNYQNFEINIEVHAIQTCRMKYWNSKYHKKQCENLAQH